MMMSYIQFNQRNLLIACISLAVLFAVTALYVGKQWYSDWHLSTQTIPHSSLMSLTKPDKKIEAIPEQHIFGKSLIATGDMPITNLQLTVTGIARERDAKNENVSKAYISISGSPSKIFQVGDTLPDGVEIYDITPDTVILKNGGRLEKLPLPREHLQFKPRNEDSL